MSPVRPLLYKLGLKAIWWNRELTLKCKLKCYVKLMKDPLGVSSSKGNQGTTLTSLHIGHRRRDTYVLYVLECLAMEQLD